MPPKPKFTKEQIVAIALDLVAQKGADALTARELGNALGSSARPIFTIYRSMDEVKKDVRQAAMNRFEQFDSCISENLPILKQIGMKMVLFGVREPKLYQLLFMQENDHAMTFDDVFAILGPTAEHCIHAIEQDYGLTPEAAKMLFEHMWIYTFGVGALCATRVCLFEETRLAQMLTAEFQAMMLYIQSNS